VKEEILQKLEQFKQELRSLKREVSALQVERVNRKALREAADRIATMWVEDLRSPLEYTFNVDRTIIKETAELMKRLHVISRPNNRKTSYLDTISRVLRGFDDKFILPIKQSGDSVESILDLEKIMPGLSDLAESNYMLEAINCAKAGYWRASIVMGWCAAIDRIQRKILSLGLGRFNQTSAMLKNQSKGRFKRWNKEFSISTLSELQQVFDSDLMIVLEGMGLIDANQSDRLFTCFQYRNHSAHPGEAPIDEPHVVAFFSDISSIILQNPKFSVQSKETS